MAAEGPLKELCEEVSCSICLDFFRDPVILTECSHNFCRTCLTRSWEEAGVEPSCPQCRGKAQKRKFRTNKQLANIVEIIEKLSPWEGKEAEAKGGICEKHQEPMKFFCKEDKALLCVVCGLSQEHKDHEAVPLEVAFQENRVALMAAGGLLKELCKEASCSFCLDFFRDPVTIAECGHNFCRACLTRALPSCPQCKRRTLKRKLWPNQQLANIVELIKKFRSWKGKGAKAKGGACEKHQEPLKFFCKEDETPVCMVCGLSQEHKDHEVVPLEEAFQENRAVVAARKGRVCQKHQEPMKLFCKDDKALICVVCDRSKEHRNHETLPLEEASQEYKDQFCSCLEILNNKRERIVEYKEDVEKKSQELLKRTEGDKQETIAKFRQLHMFLEEREKLLLAQMEEVEKEVARRRDEHLSRLSEELSSLENLTQEMKEKCQQPASDFLQDIQRTLRRYEEKETFENPETFPLALKWKIWDLYGISHLLESVVKQLKDNLDSGLYLQKANVTLDPETAHPNLILSEDQKSVKVGEAQDLLDNPERFDEWYILGCEGFKAGRHFWEVIVGSEEAWSLGVARKSARREGDAFTPEEGFWEVGKWNGNYSVLEDDEILTVNGELKRIRVCLDYAGGRVAFFDADRAALIYEFSGVPFSGETLLPCFWVNLKGHFQLC